MIIYPGIFQGHEWLAAAMSTRVGGVSRPPLGMNLSLNVGDEPAHVRTNRELFFGKLGIGLEELAIPGQVHGTTVRDVRGPGALPETDGLITLARRVFLCITVADCVPILLADPVTRLVAALHAGWRGTAGNIVGLALEALRDRFRVEPGNLLVFVGPAAGACCYAVGEDVASLFPPECVGSLGDQPTVDLKRANALKLSAAGIPAKNIETSPYCTISEPAMFHSYRRDGSASGRMMAVIGIL